VTVVFRGELWLNSSFNDIERERERSCFRLGFSSAVIYDPRNEGCFVLRTAFVWGLGGASGCAGSVLEVSGHDDSPLYNHGHRTRIMSYVRIPVKLWGTECHKGVINNGKAPPRFHHPTSCLKASSQASAQCAPRWSG